MTITITLPPATEERLRAQAEATGKDIATLVVEAVEARLSLAQIRLRDILARVHEEFRKSGMSEADLEKLFTEERAAERCHHPDPAKSG